MGVGLGVCYWYPVSRGQSCWTSYNAQDSPTAKNYLAQNSTEAEKPCPRTSGMTIQSTYYLQYSRVKCHLMLKYGTSRDWENIKMSIAVRVLRWWMISTVFIFKVLCVGCYLTKQKHINTSKQKERRKGKTGSREEGRRSHLNCLTHTTSWRVMTR